MSINPISIKCPECGISLDVEENRKYIFCSYCGTKIMLKNDNEYTYRRIDEAKIKQVELEQLVKLKELELEEKKRETDKKILEAKSIICLVLLSIGMFMFLLKNGFGIIPLLAAACIWFAKKGK